MSTPARPAPAVLFDTNIVLYLMHDGLVVEHRLTVRNPFRTR
jgi:predicted nucleic acid-binding protein